MRKVAFVNCKKLHEDAVLPTYATAGSVGMDLCSLQAEVIAPHSKQVIRTGLALALPDGYEAQIRPRSGFSTKNLVIIPNSPGTIDSDYRGELLIVFYNLTDIPAEIKAGQAIAQMIITECPQVILSIVSDLPVTVRGAGGFGSTDKSI